MSGFAAVQEDCVASDLFRKALEDIEIPSSFGIIIDRWRYGGLDPDEDAPRFMQGLIYAFDASKDKLDSNHYAYSLPIIPVMDVASKKLIRIDCFATGGLGDSLEPFAESDTPRKLFKTNRAAAYVPELLDHPLLNDFKPINVTQSEGASFTVEDEGSLISWQNWRVRIGFTLRKGAMLHDDFGFGDGGAGRPTNNLQFGCDCLGPVHNLDIWLTDTENKSALAKNVVCLHEQSNGIGCKHADFRTGRAAVTRLRQLVVQILIMLANYEYVFAYKLDTAGGITVETRAMGIFSVFPIDGGKTSGYGNIVSPGALAQTTSIFSPRAMSPEANPFSNGYEIRRTPVTRATCADVKPRLNRTAKMESLTKKNEISGKNVGYKFTPNATQLMLVDPESTQAKRAPFARYHLWVTGYRNGELWAAGDFTNQSKREVGGGKAMVDKRD